MSAPQPSRGAAPVGVLAELPPLETGAVRAFRMWFSGPHGRADLWTRFAAAYGARPGRTRIGALDRCFMCMVEGARRPLMRHGLACNCLGGDEAAIAHFFAASAAGDREDAMLLATLLVRADMAAALVTLAEEIAPCLVCLAEQMLRGHAHPGPPSKMTH